jgi:hypothetical protein
MTPNITWEVREHHPEGPYCEEHWAALYFPGGARWTTDEESALILLAQQVREGRTVRLEKITREVVETPHAS